ncbi:hypothetical protein EDD18DRAFT_1079621 [Armillaria luteobubalina]|uniref:Uncharacterized protein n=1 Tax=Armillaria luteobubalina TaxID=153913 RepID=A0AA39PZJ5_9AGAR|nr:hypothetical protein EDD18DRAFT_1079621 [Armillaria luteobubalina]
MCIIGALSFSDGRVGAIFARLPFFVTSATSNFIPSPSTSNEVHLCADGRFGYHDYTRVPQYYAEAYCHLPLIPRQPTALEVNHPYRDYPYMWEDVSNDDIEWTTGSVRGIGLLCQPWRDRLSRAFNHIDDRCGAMLADNGKSSEYQDLLKILRSRMQGVLDRLGHVAADAFTIQVLAATAQRFWLEIVAALDYMDWCKPVMDGIKPLGSAHRSAHRIGTFTWDVGVAQLFFKADIPVYFIRPFDSFTNQVILRAVDLTKSNICSSSPENEFPVVFDGPPSDPKKYVAQHRCLRLFQGYRDPFNFRTIHSVATLISSASATSSTIGPIRLDRTVSRRSNFSSRSGRPKPKTGKVFNDYIHAQSIHESIDTKQVKFNDIQGDYAPLALPAWSAALSSIDRYSERAKAAFPDPVAATYMFPEPRLITNANTIRQKSSLRQLDHSFDALKFRATATASDATPLRTQQWRDLLALALKRADGPSSSKSKDTPSIKAFQEAEEMLGSCMRNQGIEVQLVPPISSGDEPFDLYRGRQLVWELSELNFRYELLALDSRVAVGPSLPSEDVTAAAAALSDFNSDRQHAVLKVFPDGTLITSSETSNGDFSGDWAQRRGYIIDLREVMRGWSVPLPLACKGSMGAMETEGALRVEKAVAAHYAQTFYDFFGRPPIIPRCKPKDDH